MSAYPGTIMVRTDKGTSIAATRSTTLWSEKTGVINHPYDNKKWDNEGERAVPNLIVAY